MIISHGGRPPRTQLDEDRLPLWHKLNLCTVVLLAMSSTTCRKNEHNLYPVTGKVFYKGAPAAGAAVFFYRQGGDPFHEQTVMGVVRDDGSFELVCGPWGKGAPCGDYEVAIEWKPVIDQHAGNPRRAADRLNGRYADRNHARLHATIEAKSNELLPFDLTD